MGIPRLIRRHEVEKRTGKSRAGIYESMDAGTFPRPVKIGPRAVAWVESEIDDWLRQRIAERDGDEQNVLPKPVIEIAPHTDN